MPVYIQNMTSNVNVVGDMPLTEAQIRQLVELVARRVRDMLREENEQHALDGYRHQAAPTDDIAK